MYKCEHCGSMDLVEKRWVSVNEQSSCVEEVVQEAPMWCNSCEEHTNGIELPVVKYTYKVDMFKLQDDQLIKAEKLKFEVGASKDRFYYKFPESSGWTDWSDDYHALQFRIWLDKKRTMFQLVNIPCYPKLYLTESEQAIEEFFKGKPKIDVRVIELARVLRYDRVVDTIWVRRDSGVDSILVEQD